MRLIYLGMAMAAALPLFAADGDFMAETSSAATFRLYVSEGDVYTLESAAEVAAWPVTWQTGETVSATAMDGTAYALSEEAGDATSAQLPGKGGVWSLSVTSEGLTHAARVGVPWSVYQGDGQVIGATSVAYGTYGVDTVQDGPDRRIKDRAFLPIAYSGDDWGARSASAASTLTVTPPAAQTDPSVFNLFGTGVQPFAFDSAGRWTVLLEMADGTARTATINRHGGLIISVH